MARDHGITPGGVAIAFLAGAAVGAAVALLFAPATGEQTREFLGQRAREGRDRASAAARQGRDMLNRQRDNLTTAFERVREQQRSSTSSIRKEEQDA
jgi:gas vesicle protein